MHEAELQIADVRAQVVLSMVHDFESYTTFKPSPHHEGSVHKMLEQVVTWGAALHQVRKAA